MVVANLHNSEPITVPESPLSDHEALLAELSAFNKEALWIMAEADAIRPQSAAFEDLGNKLDVVLKSGLENLSADQMRQFKAGLVEMQEFRRHFEPRLNSFLSRHAAHLAHEKVLMARLRKLNMLAGPLPSALSNN